MPKHTRETTHHRYSLNPIPVPVNLPPTHSAMSFYSTRPVSGYYADVSTTAPQAAMAVSTYDQYAVASSHHPANQPRPSSRAAPRLLRSMDRPGRQHPARCPRLLGSELEPDPSQYFPGKTGNACRKRHERLMERKGADDWDTRKLERLCKEVHEHAQGDMARSRRSDR